MRPRGSRQPALRRQFATAMSLGVLLPALLLMIGLVWFNLDRERAGVELRTQNVAASAAKDVDEFINAHRAAVNVLAERRSEEGSVGESSRWPEDLARLRRNYPAFLTVLVTDAAGRVRFSDPPLKQAASDGVIVSDRTYFSEPARTGLPHVSDAFRGRALGTDPLIAISSPLRDAAGFAGVVEASLRTDTIAKTRFNAIHGRGYEVLLVDGSGRVIHASSGIALQSLDSIEGNGFEDILRAQTPAGSGMQRVNAVLGAPGSDDRDAYAARADLSLGWRILVLVPKRLVDRDVAARIVAPTALLVLFSLGILAASWQQMRTLQGGISGVVGTLQGFALGGSLDPRHESRIPRELLPIVSGIRELGDRLNAAYADLQLALDRQRELADSRQTILATREAEIEARTSELREAVAELDRISRTDALTGCLNYRGYREAAAETWQHAVDSDQALSVLAIDIDLFKAYNDRYGHQAGDNALRRFAGAVRSSLYAVGDSLARTGGEEFVVLLPGTSLAQAVEVADRIRASVARAGIIHEGSVGGVMTVSVGVASRAMAVDDDPDAMLRRADVALYQAKQAGRDRSFAAT